MTTQSFVLDGATPRDITYSELGLFLRPVNVPLNVICKYRMFPTKETLLASLKCHAMMVVLRLKLIHTHNPFFFFFF